MRFINDNNDPDFWTRDRDVVYPPLPTFPALNAKI